MSVPPSRDRSRPPASPSESSASGRRSDYCRSASSPDSFGSSKARRLRSGLLAALLCLPLLAPFAPPAAAQTAQALVSNLGQTTETTADADLNADSAQAFTTGSHATGYKLTSVDLKFGTIIQAGTYSTFTVAVHTDSSGSPGTQVGTLTVPTISTTDDQTVNFAASGDGLDLAANTTYWFVFDVTAVGGSSAFEDLTLTQSDSEYAGAASGWSIADSSLYRDWNASSWSCDSANSLQLQINGTTKPPATLSISAPADAAEGDADTRDLTFTVSLSEAISADVFYKVCFSGTATVDTTAAATIPASADYQPLARDADNNPFPEPSSCFTGTRFGALCTKPP